MVMTEGRSAEEYETASAMTAIGMTEKPAIGAVPKYLKTLLVPTPRPDRNEVAIQLRASAMHIDEIYAAQGSALGRFFGPKVVSTTSPYILGSSVSGVVVGLGEGVERFHLGDEVIAIPSEKGETGSWATYRCIAESMVMRKPSVLSHVEAAAVTMASCVAFGAIERSNVEPGARCVVVGASGAVGSMMLQFLKARGCYVTAICSASSESLVRALGADDVIDYAKDDFGDLLSERGELQDAVLDCVGGHAVEASGVAALKRRGTLVTVVGPQRYIGETKLSRWEVTKIMAHIARRMVTSKLVGPRYVFSGALPRKVVGAALSEVIEHDIRMPVHAVIPFEVGAIVAAVEALTTHRSRGRTVIDFALPVGGDTDGDPATD
jgi:NADPH:quinone reductase-like Zn-dependent oxidoreductase